MKRAKLALGLCAAPLLLAKTVHAAPVEWTSFSGGNGHFYELVQPAGGITWTDASTAAQARTYRGVSGQLASVTSAAENSFVTSHLPGWAWIGLSNAVNPAFYAWTTGEPFSYTNWESGQPTQGAEHYVHYSGALGSWKWNDLTNSTSYPGPIPLGYLVEYAVPIDPKRAVAKNLNTGFNNGAQLANGAADPNYTVIGSPVPPKIQSTPLPAVWLADSASTKSRWIVLPGTGAEGITVPVGVYTYRTTVDLTAFDPKTAEIAGLQFAADNSVLKVTLNGADVYTPGNNGLDKFYAAEDIGLGLFHNGLNTIEFQVNNATASPMGLRVEGQVVADVLHAGDANLDGRVDLKDLVIVAQHYNTIGGQTRQSGDLTGDGNVLFDDLVKVAQEYGLGPASAADMQPAMTSVPEPSAVWLLAVGAIGFRIRHRRG